MNAFITGSHAYGTPGPDSDVDLVILVTSEDMAILLDAADESDDVCENEYSGPQSANLRFGKLNIIAVTSEAAFAVWKAGTEGLSIERSSKIIESWGVPDREHCKAFFRKLREMCLG